MKRLVVVLGLAFALAALHAVPTSAAANLVQNGGFETGVHNALPVGYDVGDAHIPGWLETGEGVDWGYNVNIAGAPSAQEGTRFIDLVGGGAGKIEQVVPTTSGVQYTLSFFYAAHPCVGPGIATARATAGAASLEIQSPGSNVYKQATVAFTAASDSTTISFESLIGGSSCRGGVLIDNVSVFDASSPPPCTPAPGPPLPGGQLCGAPRGTASIRGGTGCQDAPFRVVVRGRQISRVVFYLDGRNVRTLTRPNRGSLYVVPINPRTLRRGTHRVLARVTFRSQSATRARTLRITFSKCT